VELGYRFLGTSEKTLVFVLGPSRFNIPDTTSTIDLSDPKWLPVSGWASGRDTAGWFNGCVTGMLEVIKIDPFGSL